MVEFGVYLAVRALEMACRGLSLRGCTRLGAVLGEIGAVVGWGYDRLAGENWRLAFGKPAGRRERAALWRRMCGNLLASLRFPSLAPAALEAAVELGHPDRLRDALAKGKGVVMVTGHMGSWEVLAQAAQMMPDVTFHTLFQPLSNGRLDRWLRRRRGSKGVGLLSRRGAWNGACRRLREGHVVAVFADQHAGKHGIWTPFFGRMASTSPLPAMLAARTGAVIVPVAVRTRGPARWSTDFFPAMETEGLDVGEVTHRINGQLEMMIRREPADWFWVHERWKVPNPAFLLSAAPRGVHVPPDVAIQPFRILVRAPNWLGDAVMHLRFMESLKRGRADAHLTVLAQPKVAALFRRCEFVDEVIETAPSRSVLGTAARLRQRRFDMGVLMPASWRVVLEAWLGGVHLRAGFRLRGRGRLAITHKVAPQLARRAGEHQSLEWLRAVACFGGKPAERAPRLSGADEGRRTVGIIAPGAEYGPAKRWAPERFAEAAKALLPRVGEWIVVGGAGDAAAAGAVAAALGDACRDLCGRTSLDELIGHLLKARIVLSNDSGVMHLAAACGAPTVAVFGSTEPRLTRPVHDGVAIARRHVPCSPCFLRQCPLGHMACLDAVRVADVVALAEALLDGRGAGCRDGLAWVPEVP